MIAHRYIVVSFAVLLIVVRLKIFSINRAVVIGHLLIRVYSERIV